MSCKTCMHMVCTSTHLYHFAYAHRTFLIYLLHYKVHMSPCDVFVKCMKSLSIPSLPSLQSHPIVNIIIFQLAFGRHTYVGRIRGRLLDIRMYYQCPLCMLPTYTDNSSSLLSSVHTWTLPLRTLLPHLDTPHMAVGPLMELITG